MGSGSGRSKLSQFFVLFQMDCSILPWVTSICLKAVKLSFLILSFINNSSFSLYVSKPLRRIIPQSILKLFTKPSVMPCQSQAWKLNLPCLTIILSCQPPSNQTAIHNCPFSHLCKSLQFHTHFIFPDFLTTCKLSPSYLLSRIAVNIG